VIAQRPTTGNSDIAAKTGSTYISGIVIESGKIPMVNLWDFRPQYTPSSKNCHRTIARTTDNRKWQYRRFGRQRRYFSSPSLSQSLGNTFIELTVVENPEFAVEISTLS